MSRSSRRKARRLRHARQVAARARVERRRVEIAAGSRRNRRLYTARDRQALGLAGVGRKQRDKHSLRRWARLEELRTARLARLLERLRDATSGTPVEVLTLDGLGGVCPVTAEGTARTRGGHVLRWAFRFRYDRAFLEVGEEDAEFPGLVGECLLAASRDDVTGEPYAGFLADSDVVQLIADLFAHLAPPPAGSRWLERAENTLALLDGTGDPAAPSLIRPLPAAPAEAGR